MLQQHTRLPNNGLHLLVGALLGELGGRLLELLVLRVLEPAVLRVGAADVLAREARRAFVAHVVVAPRVPPRACLATPTAWPARSAPCEC